MAAVLGASVAGVAATVITAQMRGTATPAAAPPAVTVTVEPPAPAPPVPLPARDADRHTCMKGWLAARDLEVSAGAVRAGVLPQGMKLDDPAIPRNPEWVAAVRRSTELISQAGDVLTANIAPGTTPLLADTAHMTASALETQAYAFRTFDPAMGNAASIMDEAGELIAAVCTRLVPE